MERVYARNETRFGKGRECFEELIGWLGSASVLGQSHEAIEAGLERRGCELLRQLYQDHLDVRSLKEQRRRCQERGGKRQEVRRRERGLMSVFGRVRVNRLSYRKRGASRSEMPMDRELNMPGESTSYGVRRRVAIEASKTSFESVVATLKETTGARVAKRQVEQLAQRAAQDFDAFYQQQVYPAAAATDLLVLSFDGKGVVMHPEDLRDETRRDALKRPKKSDMRPTRGRELGHKRMAQVATVYDVAPYPRDIEAVVGELDPIQRIRSPRPRPVNKRVWASVTHEGETVIEHAVAHALLRDPQQQRHWIVTVDGDPKQLRKIRRVIKQTGIKAHIVIDIIHVLEYLWAAATRLLGRVAQRKAWVKARLRRILQGKVSSVAAGMRRSATLRGLSKHAKDPLQTCARYLLNNKALMRYPQALQAGWPIGTGVIEGACRYLVKDRLGITGARWRLPAAEAVLRLRALRASGDFDAYWRFHLAAEHHRTYPDHDLSHPKPPLALAS